MTLAAEMSGGTLSVVVHPVGQAFKDGDSVPGRVYMGKGRAAQDVSFPDDRPWPALSAQMTVCGSPRRKLKST